jgi:hypothetical protein
MPRRPLDQYETPPHYVEPLLQLIGPLDGLRVYEPCVGRGHISRYLTAAQELRTNDIDPACEADTHYDARLWEAWHEEAEPWDWTITNPPFSDELLIVNRAIESSKNVAFLARLSFLEPTRSRAIFWDVYPPSQLIVLPRYSFRLNDEGKRQTDNVTCIWIVWRYEHRVESSVPLRPIQFSLWRPSLPPVAVDDSVPSR